MNLVRPILLATLFSTLALQASHAADPLAPMAQRRAIDAESGNLRIAQERLNWDPAKTAIIVCDMWDKHWCEGATRRVAEMAPAMDKVLRIARETGVLVIHAPSDTMDAYKDAPQRRRAIDAPMSAMPNEDTWKALDDSHEGPLPIDDSDGGCNCVPQCPNVNKRMWTRQIDTLSIGPDDAITDNGQEVFNLLKQQGRENVIVMGVHTNMCVLGRPFSIRAQVRNGFHVALMRDLTDTMYNARMRPYVDHFRGTDLVVAHIERHWCQTITSAAFTGEAPFAFAEDTRTHAVFLLHENEYETQKTMTEFAETELAAPFGWKCTYLFGDTPHDLPGLEALADADLMVVSVRRQILPASQLEWVKAYAATNKPIVGIRTASHAFALRTPDLPPGGVEWKEFDAQILGGNYTNHVDNKDPKAPRTYAWTLPEQANHPILNGVRADRFVTTSWLYKVSPLAPTATPLMMGRVEGLSNDEPVAWTNLRPSGDRSVNGRVFYTSLGHQDDFNDKNFRRLLLNGIVWAAKP